jgi:environmental stress-induced protein Ves
MISNRLQSLPASGYQRQLWKNGKGETCEIARDDRSVFHWRISTATLVTDGAFSRFPGYDRILILLDGGPITLQLGGQTAVELERLDSHSFPGDTDVFMKIMAPGHDLNIFTLRDAARAFADFVALGDKEEIIELKGKERFFYCISGQAEIALAGDLGESRTLEGGDTLRILGQFLSSSDHVRMTGTHGTNIVMISIDSLK